jgi:hypothetical protein
MINWKGFGNGHHLIRRDYPSIHQEGLRKIMKNLSWDSSLGVNI